MRRIYSQVIPVTFLSLIIGACSSSDGALPDAFGGSGSENGTQETDQLDGGDNGSVAGTQIADQTGGDTGGTVTDGVGTTGGGTDIVGAAAVPTMQGEWVTGCLQLGPIFSRETLSVVGARMLTELSAYSDQACTVPVLFGTVINGSTIQRNATTVPTGFTRTVSLGEAIEVNFYFEEATVDNKPLSTDAFPERDNYIEKTEYDIVLVQNDVLYFGDNNIDGYAGDSAENRPVSLNTLSIFTRTP